MILSYRLFNVLRHWVDNYWHDFTQDPSLIGSLELFLDRVIKDNIEVTRAPAQSVSASLIAKVRYNFSTMIQLDHISDRFLSGRSDRSKFVSALNSIVSLIELSK